MPNLNDPAEFDLIRKIYFEPPEFKNKDIDEEERLERQERGNITNQAR